MLKQTVRALLVIFVSVTLTVQTVKECRVEKAALLSEGNNLLFFHAAVRCPTCLTMERLTEKALNCFFQDDIQNGRLVFSVCDYESAAQKNTVEKLQIGTAGLVIAEVQDGQIVKSRNLLKESWQFVGDETGFIEMLRKNVGDFLSGKESDNSLEEDDREMILKSTENLFDNEE